MNRPMEISLTAEEEGLLAQIDFDFNYRTDRARVLESLQAAKTLALSLLERDAIPEMRWAYFTEANYNIGSKWSRLEIFAKNGTSGEKILEHPHFLKYLRYFLFGPELLPDTVAGFLKIVEADAGTSGEVLDQLRAYARRQVRELRADRRRLAEEFYKLALEYEETEYIARSIRDAALSTR